MATLQVISGNVLLAESYYLILLAELRSEMMDTGQCGSVLLKKIELLNRLIRALRWDITDQINDGTTTVLHGLLVAEISDYSGSALANSTYISIPYPVNRTTNRAQTYYLVDANDTEISRITTDGIGKTQIFSSANVLLFELSETEVAEVPAEVISAIVEPPVIAITMSFVGGTDTLAGGIANVILDASASYSPDGSPVTIQWETTSGTFI